MADCNGSHFSDHSALALALPDWTSNSLGSKQSSKLDSITQDPQEHEALLQNLTLCLRERSNIQIVYDSMCHDQRTFTINNLYNPIHVKEKWWSHMKPVASKGLNLSLMLKQLSYIQGSNASGVSWLERSYCRDFWGWMVERWFSYVFMSWGGFLPPSKATCLQLITGWMVCLADQLYMWDKSDTLAASKHPPKISAFARVLFGIHKGFT